MPREAVEAQPTDMSGWMSLETVHCKTVVHARCGRWRYLAGRGTRFPDFAFDAIPIPYTDRLLVTLGLRVHRKAGCQAEATEPDGPADYRDSVPE